MDSIRPIIKELERIYDYVAKKNNLKAARPIITIQTKGRGKSLGWHWREKWQLGKKIIRSEINICAKYLNKNPIETLIHEMVHYHNEVNSIQDCNAHRYHNKHFKITAESYGLNVEKQGRLGWALTTISDQLQKELKELKIDKKLFNLYRKINPGIFNPTKMIKYRCNCTTVRYATDLQAVCQICKQIFKNMED